ncbi:MAG: stalk domain-containing protein [Fimbriimonas sp.]
MELPLYKLEGKGYVPVRKIATLLGANLTYDPATGTVKF